MPTFGFEAEFEVATPEMVAHIRQLDRQMIGDSELHRYHCECRSCAVIPVTDESDERYDGSDYVFPLRAQRDSTCAGELISKVFNSIDEAIPVFQVMEAAALEVDAEPGFTSGLHVHVGIDGISRSHLDTAFYEWLRWENAFIRLATGRFAYLRDMNRSVRSELQYHIEEQVNLHFRGQNYERYPTTSEFVHLARTNNDVKNSLHQSHRRNDRHTALCVLTRYNTWEFRIWNSTRSAWRMELACRFSMAFMDASFIRALRAYDENPDNDPDVMEHLIDTLSRMRSYERLAELMNRQYNYFVNDVHRTPAEFVSVVGPT